MYQSSDNEASIHQPQRGYFIRIVTLLLVLFALLAVGVSIAMAQDASGNTIFLPLVTNNGASVAVEDESSENAVVNAFPQDVEPPPADDEVQAAVVNALPMAEVQIFGTSADTAATIADGVYLVKALHSDKCMEVAGAGTANGSNVQQRSCNPTARHHQWQFTAVGNGYYKITNLNSGKVLDVAWISTADGANILQWDNLDGSNQKWKLVAQSDGSHQLVAAHSNKCADVSGASIADGAIMVQYGCHTGTNQRFILTPVTTNATLPEGVYLVKALHSDKCMEVAGVGTANGSNVQQWSCNPTASHHQWQFTAVGNGYYKITNVNSGKVLDVAWGSTADEANILQWDYLNGNNQKWKPVIQSDGSYQLVAAHSNKCADVWGISTADGANIIQYGCHTGANQRFRLLPAGIESLKGVAIPEDANISAYVVNRQAAKALGKALFWDMAVSSDGQTACASCHFHAGADPRTKNQLNPGILHLAGAPTNRIYNPTRSGNAGGVNYRITAADFPTFVLADPHNRDSQILFQTDDVVSSQGVYSERYVDTTPGNPSDQCALVFDNRFHLGNISTRRVEPRNTPTTINAVFNLRNFWDGRASETFNGVNPFGTRDTSAGIYQFNGFWVSKIQPNLRFSSLASQAVGPPLSDFEMSCAQRLWPNVGRRLLSRYALQGQQVASNDSLLSSYRAASGVGLSVTYQQLIDQAFNAAYRNNSWQVSLGGVNYKLSEANFSFFFGLAVQLYESTLVSDNAPIDRYLSGSDNYALTAQEMRGAAIFSGKGKCAACHSGPQLTNAGSPAIKDFKEGAIVSHMILGDGQPAIYDEGFYNIGVRPTIEDIGLGGADPFGNPLSFSAQYKKFLQSWTPFVDKNLTVNPCTFEVNPCVTPPGSVRTAVDGAFKTPTLRNIELTGPYFHNGSRSTLEQVVEFYNRGGDRRGSNTNNTSGFGSNPSNLDADIEPLGLSASEQADLVAFLKRPLTDRRVQCDQAPFDHPQLTIPNGHVGNNVAVTNDGTGRAVNEWFTIPAVGANGMCAADMSGRRRTFEEILAANGVFASEAQATAFAETLSTPLTADVALVTDAPVADETPVERIDLPDAMIVIEEEVAVTLVDETATNEAPYRVYLPQINY
jgi:cytochrome c peroxidase